MSKFMHDHALVIGASVAGILAAAVASKTFRRVTVIERDALVDTPEQRRGVPQGGQIHALLPVGMERMEEIFSGFRQELIDAGAGVFDEVANTATLTSSGWKKRIAGFDPWVACPRPVIDMVLRRRLMQLPNVEVRYASVVGLQLSEPDGKRRVTGIELKGGEILTADLIINAGGRRSSAPAWLEAHDIEPPKQTFVNSYIGYSTQYVRFPEGTFKHGVESVVAPPWPGKHRGVALIPVGGGIHVVCALGAMRDHPSRDPGELIEFFRTGTCPIVADMMLNAETVVAPQTYAVDGSLMRQWHEVKNMPDRFIVVGDAAASLNPVYGQGMSLSALASGVLERHLTGAETLDGVAKAVQTELAGILHANFMLPATGDACFEGAEWSEDFTPLSEDEMNFGLAMQTLTTERVDIAAAVTAAYFGLRTENFGAPKIVSACMEWLAGDRVVPAFDPENYPSEVENLN